MLCIGIISLNRFEAPKILKDTFFGDNISFFSLSPDLYYTTINLTKNKKYDYLIIGGSASHMIAIQKFLNNHYGKIVFLNLPYASSLELYEILSYFLKMHPEIKTVLVSLEYQGYIKCYSERKASKPGNLCSDIIKLYFSFDSTKKSLKYFYNDILLYLKKRNKDKKENMNFHQTRNQSENLDRNKNITHNEQAGNINPEQIKEPDNKFLFLYNEKRHYCFNEITCEHDGIKNVRKIYNFLKDRNIKAVYFIPPSHANYLSLLYLDHKYSTIETFKRGIASIRLILLNISGKMFFILIIQYLEKRFQVVFLKIKLMKT